MKVRAAPPRSFSPRAAKAVGRRWRPAIHKSTYDGGPKDVETWFYSRPEIERAFTPFFITEHVEALPLLFAPHLPLRPDRYPWLTRGLEPLERRAARWPLLRDLGDHVLPRLRRR